MTSSNESVVNEGDYIIVKRHNYFKLHQVSLKTNLMLGKDKVDLSCIVGKPPWTLYKMVPKKNREYFLQVCSKAVKLSDVIIKDGSCGTDNRTIINDNKSQLLSSEEISGMRDNGISSATILTALIENSTTFKNKTEYSQAKYLKKKEKKYEDCISIIRPTLRLVSEILFNRDQLKVHGLRFDTLSQMMTAVNIQPNGIYMVFENGTQGLVASALLNQCSIHATIISMSLGIHSQRQAILAMNYPGVVLDRIINVKTASLLQLLNGESSELKKFEDSFEIQNDNSLEECSEDNRKRSATGGDTNPDLAKKPRWADDLKEASRLLTSVGADGFIIACKEYPLALITNFEKYLKASRNLVVYSAFREPLVELYTELKKRKFYVNLHLTETFLRHYQVLPERTHPLVVMSPSGGFLLTATTVFNDSP